MTTTEPTLRDGRVAFAVAVGSACGAAARWAVGVALDVGAAATGAFPWPTLAVNLVGCLLIGLVAASREIAGTPVGRAFVVTGVLGGFTTMSAFAVEIDDLAGADRSDVAAVYVGASLGIGLAATWLGSAIAARRTRSAP